MKTVIVQETDRAILDVITIALEFAGFKVYPVMSVEKDFIDLILKLKPHIIILEFSLKGLEGKRHCKNIKQKFSEIPVLALSCNNNIDQQYQVYGFDGFINKPFDLDQLYEILHSHLKENKVPVSIS